MICLSVAGGYSLSVSHAAFSQGLKTASSNDGALRAVTDAPNLVFTQFREDSFDPKSSSQPRTNPEQSMPNSSPTPSAPQPEPEFNQKPEPRPERDSERIADKAPLILVPSLSAPIRADISRKYRSNLANRTFTPERRITRTPQPTREILRISPVPGYLIGVFR